MRMTRYDQDVQSRACASPRYGAGAGPPGRGIVRHVPRPANTNDDPTAVAAKTGPTSAIDEDLYCLTCGYNLRGLSGDPVRCPECGQFNDLETMRFPAATIRYAMRQIETAPTLCVLGTCLVVMGGGLVAVFRLLPTALPAAGATRLSALCIGLAAVGLVVLYVGYTRTRRAFEDRAGWQRILRDFHLTTLLCTAAPVVGVLAGRGLKWAVEGREGSAVVWFGFAAAMASIAAGLWVYYAARSRLRSIQADVAVHIARKELHRRRRRWRPITLR